MFDEKTIQTFDLNAESPPSESNDIACNFMTLEPNFA